MKHSEFVIGEEFYLNDARFKCTDIGTRVVVAIRVDLVEVSNAQGDTIWLSTEDAEARGWFKGPPYAIAEYAFDEDDFAACSRREKPNA